MDHIQGLGFFGPLYDPRIEVHIWGPASSTLPLEARLSRYLSPPLFTVHLRDIPRVFCHHVPRPPFDIGPFHIQSSLVCHPGPTVGFRIELDGSVVTYLPDHEPILTIRSNRREPEWISGYDLAVGSDLLIHDAQYTDEEYEQRVGWGHSSFRHAFEFAAYTGVKNLVPFHHDPSHNDEMLDELLEGEKRRFQPTFRVTPGHEGAVFDLIEGKRS
jgi:phosphoribosyl 1,2-cyclic phosphodiesterase